MKWLNTFKRKQTRADMVAEHLKEVEPMKVYITDKRTPEQEEMFKEQKRIQTLLGFDHGDSHQNWLRMHQILLAHENRIEQLEGERDYTEGTNDVLIAENQRLEAKLAKAVETLRFYASIYKDPFGNRARAVLPELEGQ